MKTCVNLKENKAQCPCTYPSCPRKGMCCECIRHHLKSNELPACCFPPEIEKSFDRSFEKFIQVNK